MRLLMLLVLFVCLLLLLMPLQERLFPLWDWVGGRYSVCSSVGALPLSLKYGFRQFENFLAGEAVASVIACKSLILVPTPRSGVLYNKVIILCFFRQQIIGPNDAKKSRLRGENPFVQANVELSHLSEARVNTKPK